MFDFSEARAHCAPSMEFSQNRLGNSAPRPSAQRFWSVTINITKTLDVCSDKTGAADMPRTVVSRSKNTSLGLTSAQRHPAKVGLTVD